MSYIFNEDLTVYNAHQITDLYYLVQTYRS